MIGSKEDIDAVIVMTANGLRISRAELEDVTSVREQAAGLLALAVAETAPQRLRAAADALIQRLKQFRPQPSRPSFARAQRSAPLRVVP